MHNEVQTLKKLAQVHECAKAFADASNAVRVATAELDHAYTSWKHRNHVIDFVERGSATWKAMMLGTATYYQALQNAKARKRRAEAKLVRVMRG